MLEALNVSYSIDGKVLLDELTLGLNPGELLVVVGPNGAGKSTLIKCLSGEYSPEKGMIKLNDKPLHSIPLRQQAQLRAVLPQSSALIFPFKVHEVVKMGRSPHSGCGIEIDRHIVNESLKMADAVHLQQRIFTSLSGGEKQRVHLARVLAQIWSQKSDTTSRFLLLDEPTSALDLAHQHKTLMTVKTLAASYGIGVLVVLHDLNLAAYYAHRIALLHDGKLLSLGSPETALTSDNINQAFGIPVQVIDHPVHAGCRLVVSPAQMTRVQVGIC